MDEKPKITQQPPRHFWFPHLLSTLHNLGGSAKSKEAIQQTSSSFDVSDTVRDEPKNDTITILDNTIAWARYYLMLAGYIDSPERGVWALSDKAKKELPNILELIKKDITAGMGGFPVPTGNTPNVDPFNREVINLFRPAQAQRNSSQQQQNEQQDNGDTSESAEQKTESDLISKDELDAAEKALQLNNELEVITNMHPLQFERLCKKLFERMDYKDVKNTPPTKDGGFDGVGYLAFGLVRFKVAFEAKKHAPTSTIGERDIKVFESSMRNIEAEKGVFITTANFTKDAKAFAAQNGKIALINGEKLINILRELKIGYIEKAIINPEFFKNL